MNGWRARRDERGSVTAELAVGLPVVVVVLAAVLGVAGAGAVRLECAAGARAGARAAALGEPDAQVRQTAAKVASGGASVRITRDGEWVTVRVDRTWGSAVLGGLPLSAEATGRAEP